MGLATGAVAADATATILLSGVARNDTWTWTVGGILYLSTAVGTMTQTQPAATDDVIQVLGEALAATRILFDPSHDYMTHT